jgi:hypothetical protein
MGLQLPQGNVLQIHKQMLLCAQSMVIAVCAANHLVFKKEGM